MLSHEQLVDLIALRFSMPEWATFRKVVLDGRIADAISVNLFYSRRYEVVGFEAKSSRSDWLRELADGAKADAIARHCHRWWIVANPGVVKPDELPAGWGLMLPSRGTIRQAVAPKRCEAQLLPPALLASILRRARELSVDDAAIHVAEERAFKLGKEAGQDESADHFTRGELANLRRSVAKFEEASGVKIDAYNGETIGAAVKLVLAMPNRDYWLYEHIEAQAHQLELAANGIRRAVRDARRASGLTPEPGKTREI